MNRIMINFKKIMMFWISIKLMMNFKIRIKISQFYKKIQIFKAIKWICKKKKFYSWRSRLRLQIWLKWLQRSKWKWKNSRGLRKWWGERRLRDEIFAKISRLEIQRERDSTGSDSWKRR